MANITKTPKTTSALSTFGDLDDFYEGFFRPMRLWNSPENTAMPAMDVTENDKHIEVSTELPGVKKEDIEVTLTNGLLTIRGEKSSKTEEKKKGRVIRQERSYGEYTRQLQLGDNVDADQIDAHCKDGVLTLTIPKKTETVSKEVKVEVH